MKKLIKLIILSLMIALLLCCEKEEFFPVNKFEKYVIGTWQQTKVNDVSIIDNIVGRQVLDFEIIYRFSEDLTFTITEDGFVKASGQWCTSIQDNTDTFLYLNKECWQWEGFYKQDSCQTINNFELKLELEKKLLPPPNK